MRRLPLLLAALLGIAPQGREGFQTDSRFKAVGVFSELNPAGAAVTPDGKTLVMLVGGPDEHWVLEWDLETGEQRRFTNLKGLSKPNAKLMLSPTGLWIWRVEYKELREKKIDQYGAKYEHVRPHSQFELLDPRSGRLDDTQKVFWQEDQAVGNNDELKYMVYTVGGRVLLGGTVADQKKIGLTPVRGAFEFSPDFRYLAGQAVATTASTIFDGTARRVVVTPPALQGTQGFLPCFGFSPNSKFAAASIGLGIAEIYKLADGKPLGQVQGPKSAIAALRVDKEAARLCAVYQDRTIQFWEVRGPKLIRSHPLPFDAAACRLLVTPDGARVVLLGPRGASIYEFATGECLRTIYTALPSERVVSADGKLTAALFDNFTVGLWRLDPAVFLWSRTLEKPVMRIHLTAKGDLLFAEPNAGPIVVLETGTGKTKAALERGGEEILVGTDAEGETAILSNGTGLRRVAVADSKNLWTLSIAPSSLIVASFDGKTVLACGQKIQLIDAEKGTVVLALPQEPVQAVLVSPDGARFVLVNRDEAKVLDRAGKLIRKIRLGAPIAARKPAWSPDGKRIIFPDVGKITVYEGKTGEVTRTYAYNTRASMASNALVTRDSVGIVIEGVQVVCRSGD